MDEGFESLSRQLSGATTRRGALKMMSAVLIGGIASAVLRPLRAQADAVCPAGRTPCGPSCCDPGIACLDSASGTCGCATGTTACGTHCCAKGEACSDQATSCCCASGQTPCGPACCAKGVACINSATGPCGCPARYTQCVNGDAVTCCPTGKACGSSGCVAASSLGGTAKTCSACKSYGTTCTTGTDCCTGVCNTFSGLGQPPQQFCGCRTASDCPPPSPGFMLTGCGCSIPGFISNPNGCCYSLII